MAINIINVPKEALINALTHYSYQMNKVLKRWSGKKDKYYRQYKDDAGTISYLPDWLLKANEETVSISWIDEFDMKKADLDSLNGQLSLYEEYIENHMMYRLKELNKIKEAIEKEIKNRKGIK